MGILSPIFVSICPILFFSVALFLHSEFNNEIEMKIKHWLLLMLLVGTGRAVCMASSSLVTYPAPEGVDLNDDFTVQVRQDGGEWKTLPSYLVKVDEVRDTKHCVEDASMAIFDFSGKVDVKAVYNKGKALVSVRFLTTYRAGWRGMPFVSN